MRSGWPAAVRLLGCGAACLAMAFTACVGGASAAPGGSPAGYPSRGQVARANQAANRAEAALSPAQAALVAAQRRLAGLETAAEQARGRYARAAMRESAARRGAAAAEGHAQQTAAYAQAAESLLGRLVAQVYRTGAATDLGSLTIILDVQDPQQYLSGMHVVRRELANQASIVGQTAAASRSAADARVRANQAEEALRADQAALARSATAAEQAVDLAETQVAALGGQVDALLARQAAAQRTANELTEQRQAALAAQAAQQAAQAAEQARQQAQQAAQQAPDGGPVGAGDGGGQGGQPGAGAPPYSAGIANQVLAYASAQLGKPYQWGGIGPDSFDCSGLAMRAYESAGIDLPHFAAFQYQVSHPLLYGQLRPGDLLFWATDPNDSDTIYHEAIYLGGQKMIQAPKTGWNVMISDMWMWGPIQFYARPY